MAWKDGFVIDYKKPEETSDKGKLSCRMCRHFKADRSCSATGQFIPTVGCDCWKSCVFFALSERHDTDKNRPKLKRHCEDSGIELRDWKPCTNPVMQYKTSIICKGRGMGFVVASDAESFSVKFKRSGSIVDFRFPEDIENGVCRAANQKVLKARMARLPHRSE